MKRSGFQLAVSATALCRHGAILLWLWMVVSVIGGPARSDPFVVSTFAGRTGGIGHSDGGSDIARFEMISGITADRAGNLYIIDASTIRKIDTNRTVKTIAGKWGVTGTNDGPAAVATFGPVWGYLQFPRLQGIAVDSDENVFVADFWYRTIRRIDRNGIVSTFAGRPGVGGARDGKGTDALFSEPRGLCFDGQNNLYVTDSGDDPALRKIAPDGTVTTLSLRTRDGEPFKFTTPEAMVFGRNGLLYVSDATGLTNLWKITADGTVLAAQNVEQQGGSFLKSPSGLALTAAGDLVVSDARHFLQLVSPDGKLSPFVGAADTPGSATGSTDAARFYGIRGITSDPDGNIFVADTANHCIRKIGRNGIITTYTGLPGGSEDGRGEEARLAHPGGIAFDSAGNLLVADNLNGNIRRINPQGDVTTIAKSPAGFQNPTDLAFDSDGNMVVRDPNHALSLAKISSNGEVSSVSLASAGMLTFLPNLLIARDETTYFSSGYGSAAPFSLVRISPSGAVIRSALRGYRDGPLNSAQFSWPSGMAEDAAGNIFVADFGNAVIRKIDPSGVVSTAAGKAGVRGKADGMSEDARFIAPQSLAFSATGKLYVLDNGVYLREIDSIRQVRTLSLAGSLGAEIIDELSESIAFKSEPVWNRGGIAVDSTGRIFVASVLDNTIKLVVPAENSVALALAPLPSGGLRLSWPAGASNLVLEATSTPDDRYSWGRVADGRDVSFHDSPKDSARCFFRLRER